MIKRTVVYCLFIFVAVQGLQGCASSGSSDDQTMEEVKEDGIVTTESDSKPAETNVQPPKEKAKKQAKVKAEPKMAAKATPAAPKMPSAPKSATPSAGKSAFKTTKMPCDMKSEPSATSATLTQIPAGRKIWAEPAGEFYKVSRTKGVGYLAMSCF